METVKTDILTLIPQRPPFVFVEELVHYDPIISKTIFTVSPRCILMEQNRLSEAGVIENIAQSCAARIGYINTVILKNRVQLGFIGGIKNLTIYQLPIVGEKLDTTIELLGEVMDMTLIKAQVCVQDQIIAEGEMKIALR